MQQVAPVFGLRVGRRLQDVGDAVVPEAVANGLFRDSMTIRYAERD